MILKPVKPRPRTEALQKGPQELNYLTRRRMLAMSLACGGYALSSPFSRLLAQERLRRTPDQILGPYYPVLKPLDTDADLTTIRGRAGRAKGQVIHLMGRVLNLKGEPVAGARVEIWQADAQGRYAHPDDTRPVPLDTAFQGYGAQVTDAQGRYRFKTIKPGAYPAAGGDWTRAPHVHFGVKGRANQFITQMYFEGEPLNDTDRFLRSAGEPRMLVAKLSHPAKDFEPDSLVVNWDIVLLSG